LYFATEQDDAWVNSAAYHLRGTVDVSALQRAVRAVMCHHGSLRTVFSVEADGVHELSPGSSASCFQHVRDADDLEWWIVMEGGPCCSARAFLESRPKGLDVTVGPCFRCRVSLTHDGGFVAFDAHHAVMDGTSWGIFLAEVAANYNSSLRAAKFAMAAADDRYLSWTIRRMQANTQEETLTALMDIVHVLRGSENRGTTMPIDGVRCLQPGWQNELRPHSERLLRFDGDLLDGLRAAAQASGTTFFTCMVAVVHLWQWMLTGKEDLVLMATTDGRDGATSTVVGSFINDTVLRTKAPDPGSTFTDFLQRTHHTVKWALARADIAPLAAWDAIFRDTPPLPYVALFDWIPDGGESEFALDGLEVTEITDKLQTFEGIAESEFEMEFDEAAGELKISYDTTLYSTDTIDRMIDVFEQAVATAARTPDGALPPSTARCDQWLATPLPPPDECEKCIRRWQREVKECLAKHIAPSSCPD